MLKLTENMLDGDKEEALNIVHHFESDCPILEAKYNLNIPFF